MKKLFYIPGVMLVLFSLILTIIVSTAHKDTPSGTFAKNEKELSNCQTIVKNHDRELCYLKIVEHFDIKNISSYVKDIELKDGFKGSCHMVLHELGDHYSKTYSKEDLLINYKLDMDICQAGFLHGIQEGYAKHEGSKGIMEMSLIFCSMEVIPREASCLHGVGHAYSLTTDTPTKVAKECTNLTDALIVKYPQLNYEKERVNFYVKCSEGYFMKTFNDHRERYQGMTLNTVNKVCESDQVSAEAICKIAIFRPYITQLTDPSLNPDFDNKVATVRRYQERIKEMNQYCETLEADYINNCYFTKGTAVFDRYNYNSDHSPATANKVFNDCKEEAFCYKGYFFSLLTPSAVKYPTKEYLAEFCRDEVCIAERDASLAFVTYDKDITRR